MIMGNLLLLSHCVFPVPDIIKTSDYYEKVMGFRSVKYLASHEPHVCLYRDYTEIILTQSGGRNVIPNRELYGYGYDAYFITENQEQLQQELKIAGANIVKPLFKTDFHNQEFVVEDIDGRWIGFGFKED
jgi:catechol 2,3-dioxygenase-like lactoylglutathione lyase family enzyme